MKTHTLFRSKGYSVCRGGEYLWKCKPHNHFLPPRSPVYLQGPYGDRLSVEVEIPNRVSRLYPVMHRSQIRPTDSTDVENPHSTVPVPEYLSHYTPHHDIYARTDRTPSCASCVRLS